MTIPGLLTAMDFSTKPARTTIERRVILLLGTLLAANPLVVFLLTKSVLATVGVSAGCVVGMQLASSRRLLAAYLFNAIAVVSVFAHAEAVLVFAFPDYVVENLYTIEDGYYFNRPFLHQTFIDKEYSVVYRTNAQGFRIPAEQEATRTVTAVDWLFIGDSFTQGAQVDFNDLFTSKLNERFPDRIVLNAGISGLGIGHEYNYFAKAGWRLKPSLVVLQLCSFNDFMNVEPSSVGLTDRLMTHSAFLRFLLADIKFTNPAKLPLGRWTEPFQQTERANVDYNVFYRASSAIKERDLAAFKAYLGKLKRAVKDNGAELLVVLIPTKEQVYPRYLEEVQRSFAIPSSRLDMERPNRMLAELTRELRIDCLDLLEPFRTAPGNVFLEYDEHMSVLGHSLMAKAIGDRLEAKFGPAKPRRLSKELAGDRYPMWSKDGSIITYQSFRDRNMELFLASPDFSSRQRLTYNDVDESHPMLSRDNSQILFTEGSAESQQTKVVVMNVDGSGRRTLTSGRYQFGAIPSFSPSNRQVAYAEWSLDPSTKKYSRSRIAVLDVLTGERTFVTSGEREAWRPVFFPDGQQLVYIQAPQPGGHYALYSYDLRAKVEHRLTHTTFDEWDPQVSPDGSRIVYAANPDGNWDLFLYECGSGRTVRLTRTTGDEWDPSFAPDGRSLLFAGRFGLLDAIFEMTIGQ